jgi:hypothetical protein
MIKKFLREKVFRLPLENRSEVEKLNQIIVELNERIRLLEEKVDAFEEVYADSLHDSSRVAELYDLVFEKVTQEKKAEERKATYLSKE